MSLPSEPITRKEQYLAKAAGQAVEIPAEPITREEAYLDAIAKGSGGGGTSDYSQLTNKPQINGTTLIGNKSASDLSLATTADLAGKVDKVEGYGLSENDYTDADKAIVGGVTAALAGKQDTLTFDNVPTEDSNNPVKSGGIYTALAGKVNTENGKGLSTNDYSDTEKAQVATNASDIATLKSGLSNNIFKSGDIISATTSDGAISTYGFIQHMTQVYVMIPVNKPISATSFTVTDMESFFVRYDGHLVDVLANITSIGSQTILSNGCLQFAVNFNTGTFSGIEHMPAIITINAKITFV